MRPILLISAVLAIAGAGAQAETPLSGAEFDAYTRGKTLTFTESGQAYGFEEYRPGRRVTWAFADGQCQAGEWYEPEAGLICFVYEEMPDAPQCWQFFATDSGLIARFSTSPDRRELYEARQSRQPLICLGPEVGV